MQKWAKISLENQFVEFHHILEGCHCLPCLQRHGMAICQAFSLLWIFKVGCLPYCQPKFPGIRCPVNTLNRICCLNSGFRCFICLIYKRCSSSLNFSLSIRLFEPTVSGRVKEGGLRVVAGIPVTRVSDVISGGRLYLIL